MFFPFISFEQTFFIIFVALLIFGPKKIPDIAKSLGRIIRYIQNSIEEINKKIFEISEYNNDLKNKINENKKNILKGIDKNSTRSIKRDD